MRIEDAVKLSVNNMMGIKTEDLQILANNNFD